MDKIDIGAPQSGERRDRFFARSAGTVFAADTVGDATVIDLYDEVGYWGVNARSFRNRLKDAKGDIKLRINSPGGDVFDGIAMYNDLLAYDGKVTVEVTGVAASIASVIAMAGDEIVMAPNAFMMIHNAWTIGIGNRRDMQALVDVLTKVDDSLARTYASRTTTGIKSIKQMMDDETWLTAKESVEAGFASTIAEAAKSDASASAKFDLSVFGQVPKSLLWSDEDSKPQTEEDIEKLIMRDAGKTRTQARALIRDIRAGTKTSEPEAKPGAGGVELSHIAAAISQVKAAFHNTST